MPSVWIALGLFFTLWWTWVGFAVLYNRHGADEPLQRLLFLAASVPAGVAAVAIEPEVPVEASQSGAAQHVGTAGGWTALVAAMILVAALTTREGATDDDAIARLLAPERPSRTQSE